MHPVGEVNVASTGWPEHEARATVWRPVRVGAGIARASVSFDLDYPSPHPNRSHSVDQKAAQDVRGDINDVAIIKVPGKDGSFNQFVFAHGAS